MDYAEGITEYYDKGYFILGGFEYEKGWTIKTDINLEPLWDFVYEFPSLPVYVKGTVKDADGNVYVCGSVDSWPFVAKLNPCSEKIWCKVFNFEDEFDFGYSQDVVLNQNNEIILLTYLNSDEDEINITHLICIDDNGNVLWKKPYASRDDYSWIRQPTGYSLEKINSDYYISGYCYYPYPDDTLHWFLRPLFIGIDSLFEEKWVLPYYALDSVFGLAFKTTPLNDSVFMGVGVRHGFYQGLLMFYNKDGEELGYYGIEDDQLGPDINGSDIRDIARINDTLFLAAALFGPDNTGNPGGEFIVSTSGGIYGTNSRPGTHIPSITKTYDNNYVIATSIDESKGDDDIYVYKIDENLNDVPFDPTPHAYDSLCPGGIQSGTIDLTSCFVWTDVSEAPSPGEYYSFIQTIPIKVFPNPATEGSVTFEFENTEHLTPPLVPPQGGNPPHLSVYNIFGQLIHTERIYRYQEKTEVNINSWQAGMYFGVVYSNGKPAGKCKFVVSH
ncbi:MAG TPA: T9SS type A sorting domain-containing protein [Bacteroidales bacterium]|nr:T9SS type A sorting domain-containing protein [Bacteroidales bacterium]